jgi:hypothetical protein
MSVLPTRFLPIEMSVRTILSQVWPDQDVTRQLRESAERDGITLPSDLVDRLTYAFA